MQAMNMTQTQNLRGELLRNEPMAKHTSWRAGGVAEIFYKPADIDDLSLFLSQQNDVAEITFVGLGSNLLVRDAGIDGIVISIGSALSKLDINDDCSVYAEAGVASPKVARVAAKNALKGNEFLCGIPGTFGGALAMNAGAMGGETWSIVKSVTTINKQGQISIRNPDEFEIAYRSVKENKDSSFTIGKDEWFVAATLQLKRGDKDESEAKIKSHLDRRNKTQPTQQPNAGSVFRNPDGDYAARLIEECDLKGFCVGGACVSEKHANFIINKGTATAKDIESLIEHIYQTVKDTHDISLIREVRIIGNEK